MGERSNSDPRSANGRTTAYSSISGPRTEGTISCLRRRSGRYRPPPVPPGERLPGDTSLGDLAGTLTAEEAEAAEAAAEASAEADRRESDARHDGAWTVILDTSFLIDHQLGADVVVAMGEAMEAGDRLRRLPHVVLSERSIGVVEGLQSERTAAKLDGVLSALPLVGATALAHDEPVVTADVEEFERMPDVAVASY